jgi:hypothetical protein
LPAVFSPLGASGNLRFAVEQGADREWRIAYNQTTPTYVCQEASLPSQLRRGCLGTET